jgi:hypothetical protein
VPEWGSVADWVGAAAQIVAAVGTGWVIWQTRKTLDIAERAERLQIFMDFSRAYDAVKELIRPEALEHTKPTLAKTHEADVLAVLELMKLFERQHFLRFEAGMVDAKLWQIWHKGLAKNMNQPLFRLVWQHREKWPQGRALAKRFTDYVESKVYKEVL